MQVPSTLAYHSTDLNDTLYRFYTKSCWTDLILALIGQLLALLYMKFGDRGGPVGWGTALQVRRSRFRFPMVSLEFFIDIILLAALWPWGQLSL